MRTDMKVIVVPDFIIFLKAIGHNIDKSMSDICFDTRITYSHLHTIKKVFIKKQWIMIKRDGQRHIPILTPKGHQLLNVADDLLDELGITEVDILNFRKQHKTTSKVETTGEELVDAVKELPEDEIIEEDNEIYLEDGDEDV